MAVKYPNYLSRKDLKILEVRLTEDPQWKAKHYLKSSSSHWVEIHTFPEDSSLYKISGVDYKFINYNDFKREIKKGDTVVISVKDNQIYTFRKDKSKYMDFDKAQHYKKMNERWSLVIFFTIFFCCNIPLAFSERPNIKIGKKIIPVYFNVVLIICLIIVIMVASKTIGWEYVTSGKFIISFGIMD